VWFLIARTWTYQVRRRFRGLVKAVVDRVPTRGALASRDGELATRIRYLWTPATGLHRIFSLACFQS
jgi:hypothetical protein